MLLAVYQTGSSCILPNHKDIDIVYIYQTKEEAREALKNNKDFSKDNHFSWYEYEQGVFLGCYIKPFMKLISGEELDCVKDFSIFKVEAQYKALLKRATGLSQNHKQWYHIYIAVCMFKNGKMKLTKKQLDMAQKIHDEGISDKLRNELIEYLK